MDVEFQYQHGTLTIVSLPALEILETASRRQYSVESTSKQTETIKRGLKQMTAKQNNADNMNIDMQFLLLYYVTTAKSTLSGDSENV
jgi:hypothetical protein